MQPDYLVDVEEILGFDLGHAETAVAKLLTATSPDTEPRSLEVLPGHKSIVTAVAYADGHVLVGDDAATASGVAEMYAYFKQRPDLLDNTGRKAIQEFVGATLTGLRSRGVATCDKHTTIVFGHPSGWDERTRARYADLLGTAASPSQCEVVAESRAAFLHLKICPDPANRREFRVHDRLLLAAAIARSRSRRRLFPAARRKSSGEERSAAALRRTPR